MKEEIATKTTWKNFPIDKPHRIAINLFFNEQQVFRLKQGLIPEQMEDKWFIYYEEGWVYFHRSWTGFGIYKIHLFKTENGHRIRDFWVERNQEKYKNEDDQADVRAISFLIESFLLGNQKQ